jgi:hypothetical protein
VVRIALDLQPETALVPAVFVSHPIWLPSSVHRILVAYSHAASGVCQLRLERISGGHITRVQAEG